MLIRKRRVLATALVVAALSLLVVSPALAGVAPWAAPVDLSATGHDAWGSQVTVDSTGRAIAVWQRYDGLNTIIQSSWSLNGGPWSTPADLSAAGQNAEGAQVTVDSTGRATAVWSRYDGTNWVIQSSTSLNGAAWVPAPADLSAAGRDASVPQVTVDSTGRATAVWGRSDGFNNIIQSSTSLNGAAWVPAPADLSAPGQNADYPQVTVDSTGRAIAVWSRSDGTKTIIQSSTSLNGAAWVAAPANLTAAGQDAVSAQVTVDSTGRAIAVWWREDGTNRIIQSSTSLNGAAWVPAPADLSVAGRTALDPQVTVDSTGRAIAVWHRNDGTDNIIQSSATVTAVPGPAPAVPAPAPALAATGVNIVLSLGVAAVLLLAGAGIVVLRRRTKNG